MRKSKRGKNKKIISLITCTYAMFDQSRRVEIFRKGKLDVLRAKIILEVYAKKNYPFASPDLLNFSLKHFKEI